MTRSKFEVPFDEAMLDPAGYEQLQEDDPWDGLDFAPEDWDPIVPRPPRDSPRLSCEDTLGLIRELHRLREKLTPSAAHRRRVEQCQKILARELQRQPATMRKREFAVGPDRGPGPGEWWEPDHRAVTAARGFVVERVKRKMVFTPPTTLPADMSATVTKLPWTTPTLIELTGKEAYAVRMAMAGR